LLDGAHLLRITTDDILNVVPGQDAFHVDGPPHILIVPLDCREGSLAPAQSVDVREKILSEDSNKVIIEKLSESAILLKLRKAHDTSDEIVQAAFEIRVGECEGSEWDLRCGAVWRESLHRIAGALIACQLRRACKNTRLGR
jgi:hypothetical protein